MRAVISTVSAGLLTLALVTSQVRGQPAPQPDFNHATELYKSATAAMNESRFADAARDFGAAYEITRDPVLFFKIGLANEKAGRCDVALIYYGRYLREAKPETKFAGLTRERITACHGDTHDTPPALDQGSAAKPPELPSVGVTDSSGSGSAVPSAPVVPAAHGNDAAWIMVGGSLAFITAGVVLAYSASAAEQDLKDLYFAVDPNNPPVFDTKTAKRYHDLIDEGHRYQYLSWGAFGIAGACAIGAVILFAHGSHDDKEQLSVRPILTPHEAGLAAVVRF